MKKLLLILILGFSLKSFAQLNYSVSAGYTMSQVKLSANETEIEQPDSKSGYYAGFSTERKWGERIAAQVDIQYANLGYKTKSENASVNVTETVNFNRVLVPVSFRYYATYELVVFAGGYFMTNLNYKVKYDVSDNFPMTGDELDQLAKEREKYLDENLMGLDYGIHFGADFKIHKGFFVEAKYSLGLANLIKDPADGEKMTNNFLQAGIGYKF